MEENPEKDFILNIYYSTKGNLDRINAAIDEKNQDPTWLWIGSTKDREMVKVKVPDPYRASVETAKEFIAAIWGEQPVGDTTFADGLRYVEFTEAVTRSAQERQTISLPM